MDFLDSPSNSSAGTSKMETTTVNDKEDPLMDVYLKNNLPLLEAQHPERKGSTSSSSTSIAGKEPLIDLTTASTTDSIGNNKKAMEVLKLLTSFKETSIFWRVSL